MPPAAVPAAYVTQLSVYRALLQRLYPGRPVRCLIVWTNGPLAVEVPGSTLDAALLAIKAA